MATGALPTAVPPATSVKLTVLGVAETLMDSASVAFSVMVTVFEFSCAIAERAARQARAASRRQAPRTPIGNPVAEMLFFPIFI
jgi:hypothetical protein